MDNFNLTFHLISGRLSEMLIHRIETCLNLEPYPE